MDYDKTAIGRADFFKQIFREAASVAAQFAGDIMKPLNNAEKVAESILFEPLITVDEYNGEPKLLTSVKPPLYILGKPDKNLTGYAATCTNDGFLLSYLAHEDVLYCSACRTKHHLTYEEDRVVTDLQATPLAVNEGHICLAK